jgi:S-formylglutathione hydrolase FrmB
MAFLQIDHLPETVKVHSPLNIILPDPGTMNGIPVRDRKVLYLLHGLSDDASAWPRYTAIETYAKKFGLVVVMPSVGRSFYLDMPNGQKYFSYLTEELPQYLRDVFGIVPDREKTFIAGLSMGGYGALKAALTRPELYFAAGSFSGVLSMHGWNANPDDPRMTEFSMLFGDLSQLPGSNHDPSTWIINNVKNSISCPELYISCGLQDELLPTNRYFLNTCKSQGVKVEYQEEEGIHDWFFWDKQILKFLAFALDH